VRRRDVEELTVAPDGLPLKRQPKWRRDFPIDVPEDEYVARREFTKFLALTSFAFVAGQAWMLAKSLLARRPTHPGTVIARLGDVSVGGALQFEYPEGEPKLLVRLGERAVVAFDARCTHLSCPVIPDVASGRFHCPCHQGWFDLASGRPLAGPPSRPLPRVRLEVRGDEIVATGVERTVA
jgi:Rieske Fe-S protein